MSIESLCKTITKNNRIMLITSVTNALNHPCLKFIVSQSDALMIGGGLVTCSDNLKGVCKPSARIFTYGESGKVGENKLQGGIEGMVKFH